MSRTHNSNVEAGISYLKKSLFSKSKDAQNEYSSNSMIYFLELPKNKYIVLNLINYNKAAHLQGFDLWLSEYKNPNEIGVHKAITSEPLKKSVLFPKDVDFIESTIKWYITNV